MGRMEIALRGVSLTDFATEIQNRLLDEGFVVYRYDAYSTNSVYLKLDFGVCNSIRISDHKGKSNLRYRYNIGTNWPKVETKVDKYPRHYYPVSAADDMIRQILSDRDAKVRKYGKARYRKFMADNKKEHGSDAGFWKKAHRVL